MLYSLLYRLVPIEFRFHYCPSHLHKMEMCPWHGKLNNAIKRFCIQSKSDLIGSHRYSAECIVLPLERNPFKRNITTEYITDSFLKIIMKARSSSSETPRLLVKLHPYFKSLL